MYIKTSRPVGLSRSDRLDTCPTVLVPLVGRVAPTRRAELSDSSFRGVASRGIADSSDTRVEELLRQSPTHPILLRIARCRSAAVRLVRLVRLAVGQKCLRLVDSSTPRLNAARAVDCGATLTTPLLMSLSDATCYESGDRHLASRGGGGRKAKDVDNLRGGCLTPSKKCTPLEGGSV